MPYIDESLRTAELDAAIAYLTSEISKSADGTVSGTSGVLNYAITRLLTGSMPTIKYREINAAIGVLQCVSYELYRRIAVPYENQQAYDNGDIPEFQKADAMRCY